MSAVGLCEVQSDTAHRGLEPMMVVFGWFLARSGSVGVGVFDPIDPRYFRVIEPMQAVGVGGVGLNTYLYSQRF